MKYEGDFTIFDQIDTEEKAYWLGFIAGDGSIHPDGYYLTIELANIDLSHLEKFKLFMSANNHIKPTNKNCNRLRINSKHLTNSLAKYGLINNKSKTLIAPDIQLSLLKHFYRGVLDSDGWICRQKLKNCCDQFNIGFCAENKIFLEQIQNHINKVLNRSLGYLTHRKYKTGGEVWQLLFGGTKCFKDIISYLYDDFNCAIYLDRKFIKSQEFVNEINTRKRKQRVNKPKR